MNTYCLYSSCMITKEIRTARFQLKHLLRFPNSTMKLNLGRVSDATMPPNQRFSLHLAFVNVWGVILLGYMGVHGSVSACR